MKNWNLKNRFKSHKNNFIFFLLNFKINNKKKYNLDIKDLYNRNFDKIIVIASGPSTIHLDHTIITKNTLVLTTNYSNKSLLRNMGFVLHCMNDTTVLKDFFLNQNKFKNINNVLFWAFECDNLHRDRFTLLRSGFSLLKRKYFFCISDKKNINGLFQNNNSNFIFFRDRLEKMGIEMKIFNSGIFILLLGVVLCQKSSEIYIYGLDLGQGGLIHFNDVKSEPGKSVISNKVKDYVNNVLNILRSHDMTIHNRTYFNNNFYLSE